MIDNTDGREEALSEALAVFTPHREQFTGDMLVSVAKANIALVTIMRAFLRLRAENVKLRAERDAMRKALKACEDAAMSATYGPPSRWPAPGRYPRGWRHPPGWPADRRPTPEEACWHDNGVMDTLLAVRAAARALGEDSHGE